MSHISYTALLVFLIFLVVLSAFFSAAEISMMAINRYRLKHLVSKKNKFAILVDRLLKRPERLLGVVLIGNTAANIMASAAATVLAAHYFGEAGIAAATVLLTLIVLIFSEIIPKTIAASYQQPVAFFCILPLILLLKLLYPIIWFVNTLVYSLLKLMRIRLNQGKGDALTREELRTVLFETSTFISKEHRDMLLSILELEQVTVNDIMVPRHDIVGINLNDNWSVIREQLKNSPYTRLPVYRDNIDKIVGILHLRAVVSLMDEEDADPNALEEIVNAPDFVPAHTPLSRQLLHFRRHKIRTGLVVNEYGDIEGLVTLEDILEEIIGEFTTDIAESTEFVHAQSDGSYLVDGSCTIRELNRDMKWDLPTDGPKTLSGLIIEYLEHIPASGACMCIAGYPIEVVKIQDNTIKTARVMPSARKLPENENL